MPFLWRARNASVIPRSTNAPTSQPIYLSHHRTSQLRTAFANSQAGKPPYLSLIQFFCLSSERQISTVAADNPTDHIVSNADDLLGPFDADCGKFGFDILYNC
jgi:hypothetical protein